tara:strand:+ start:159 stop:494 length:336 start_codon:yes stop_codon:yes gene_type:complete
MTWEMILKGMKLESPGHETLRNLIDNIAKEKETFSAKEMFGMVQIKPTDDKMGAIGSRPWLRYKHLDIHAIIRYFKLNPNYQRDYGNQKLYFSEKANRVKDAAIHIWRWEA